jgi:UDP-4-amino-4,6-dideoxy-N-acetyl-beta-L-altrosamine N-acetyltransferase
MVNNKEYASCQGIRKMSHDDLELVLRWRNHPDVSRFMYTQHEISMEEHSCWFEKAIKNPQKHLLIFEPNRSPLGFVQLSQPKNCPIAEWGFYTAPDAPKGTGRSLGLAALQYAYDHLCLHKVCGQALAFNEPSIKFHSALGFRQEGCLREQHFDGSSYHDVLCFGLLSSEWASDHSWRRS